MFLRWRRHDIFLSIIFIMLHKNSKPGKVSTFVKRGVAIIFVGEFIAFGASYFVWRRFNANRDFRLHCYKNYTWALDGFYRLGELTNKQLNTRETDLEIWKREGKI